MTRPRLLVCALALSSCALVGPPDDGRLFKCESDRSCRPGFTCLDDGLCHPVDAGGLGGGGGTAGGLAGGGGGGGGGGAGGGPPGDAGPCGMACPANQVCGGGGATPGACGPPRVCENGFCWENPLPQGHTLRDALAFGPNDVWLVGDHGTILHSEAGGWVGLPSGTTNRLWGIHGRAPNDLYAVGERCTITHFDGTRWAVQPVAAGCVEELRAVWVLADGSALAVGAGMRALHREAGAWSPVASLPSMTTTSYFQVLGSGSDVIAVTYDLGGYRWNAALGQFERLLGAAWPVDPMRAQAVERLGDALYVCGSFGAVLRRDDDADWSVYRDGGVFFDEACTALCGTGPLDVWLTSDGDGNTPLVRHYPNGAVERPGQRSNTCVALREGQVALAGDYGFLADATDAGVVLRSRTKDAPVQNFQAVFSPGDPLALAAPRNLGAVGRRGPTGWSDPTVIPGALQSYGVWASSPSDIWVTSIDSSGGSVWRFNGSFWGPINGNAPLYGVWGLSPDEVYFGSEGSIFVSRSRGPIAPVLNLDAGGLEPVRGLWAGGSQPLTAVSFSGRIFTRSQPDGGWTAEQLPGRQLQAIHGAVLPGGAADVWAVGTLGAVFHREGGAWVWVDAGQGMTELSAVFAETDRTWVAGAGGTVLLRTDGGWAPVVTPAGAHLRGIWAQPDGGGVWLVGDFGQIVSKLPAR